MKESLNNREEKIVLENLPPIEGGGESRLASISGKVFGIVKFIIGICLLPFVYSVSLSFLNEFAAVPKTAQDYFWAGVISFIALYLFIWEPTVIYARGQKIVGLVFTFFKPLVKVAPYLLPIYTVILFVFYLLFSSLLKPGDPFNYFIFIFSFSLALHLVFSAKSIKSRQGDFLKANYIFGFSFLYILDIALLAFCLNIIFKEFSFVNFVNNFYQTGSGICSAVYRQLFFK